MDRWMDGCLGGWIDGSIDRGRFSSVTLRCRDSVEQSWLGPSALHMGAMTRARNVHGCGQPVEVARPRDSAELPRERSKNLPC